MSAEVLETPVRDNGVQRLRQLECPHPLHPLRSHPLPTRVQETQRYRPSHVLPARASATCDSDVVGQGVARLVGELVDGESRLGDAQVGGHAVPAAAVGQDPLGAPGTGTGPLEKTVAGSPERASGSFGCPDNWRRRRRRDTQASQETQDSPGEPEDRDIQGPDTGIVPRMRRHRLSPSPSCPGPEQISETLPQKAEEAGLLENNQPPTDTGNNQPVQEPPAPPAPQSRETTTVASTTSATSSHNHHRDHYQDHPHNHQNHQNHHLHSHRRTSWPARAASSASTLLMSPYCIQTQQPSALHSLDSFTTLSNPHSHHLGHLNSLSRFTSQTNQMLFTHSASFSSPAPPSSGNTSPPSSRPSRLRRFSHLRSYTPSHLLSRESSSGSSTTTTTTTTATAPSTADGLTRSTSEINAASVPRSSLLPSARTHLNIIHSADSDPVVRNRNRLTLINSAPTRGSTHTDTRNTANTSTHTNATNQATTLSAGEVSSSLSSPISEDAELPTPAVAAVQSPASQSTTSPAHSSPATTTQTQVPATMTRTRASTTGDTVSSAAATAATTAADLLPSLRLSAYYDPRSTRPSLTFPPISRTLPTGNEKLRVGRYSERDSQSMSNMPGNQPSAAPIGFKSKVVSRRHCEFWYEGGKWYIKDVKSSSGTFLNHIRLSPPSQESKAFPLNDGDIVQLGIDFKGGEEMIFRCVKMRVELNRGWQNKLNSFNMAAHKRLRTIVSSNDAANAAGSSSQDCSICLNSIAPCQSLFVAPCSHTWHFKCVRSLLTSPQYPIFICPNCRAGADLEADVDDPAEDWEQLDAEGENGNKTSVNGAPLAPAPSNAPTADDENSIMQDTDAMDVTVSVGTSDSPDAATVAAPASATATGRGNLPHATSAPLPIINRASGSGRSSPRDRHTSTPPTNGQEGPITPRNEAGPWVFDGSAGQRGEPDACAASPGMRSLDAAAAAGDITMNGDTSDTEMRC